LYSFPCDLTASAYRLVFEIVFAVLADTLLAGAVFTKKGLIVPMLVPLARLLLSF